MEINKCTARQGRSALYLAAAEGRIHAATMLLEHNADVNALSDEGQSPLIAAAANGHEEMMQLLEEHNAATDFRWMGLTAQDVIVGTSGGGGGDGASVGTKGGEGALAQSRLDSRATDSDLSQISASTLSSQSTSWGSGARRGRK